MITDARAVRIAGKGGPEVLGIGPHSVRAPGHDELLVEVVAAGLNRADVLQRRGLYPAPAGAPVDIPGLEYAGVVAAVGDGVSSHRAGDRVMGIVGGGAMATHLVVPEREALPVPASLSLAEAAAVPEVFLTAFDALFIQGALRPFETVLLHAIGSGVGTAALQPCRAAGARPIGTSRSAEKLDRAAKLGLPKGAGLLVEGGVFAAELLARTEGLGVNLILDTVGAAYTAENVRALGTCGRVVVVGLLGGAEAQLPLGHLLAKRATIRGTVLRSRPPEEKANLAQRFSREALPLFAEGKLRPVVDTVLPMERVADAHGLLERNATFGKVVLAWDPRSAGHLPGPR